MLSDLFCIQTKKQMDLDRLILSGTNQYPWSPTGTKWGRSRKLVCACKFGSAGICASFAIVIAADLWHLLFQPFNTVLHQQLSRELPGLHSQTGADYYSCFVCGFQHLGLNSFCILSSWMCREPLSCYPASWCGSNQSLCIIS